MQRREFLTYAGATTATLWGSQWLGVSATPTSDRRLIVILLRGAVDGLNVVVPYSDPLYYQYRPQIAIPQLGQTGGVIDLDGRFGLHPALAPLLPLWQQKSLAFVHASGLPKAERSHFDAQRYLETGTLSQRRSDGWLNRLLALQNQKTPSQAVSISSNLPQILTGKMAVTSIASQRQAIQKQPIDRTPVSTAFDQLYRNSELDSTYRQGRIARQNLLQDLEAEMVMANNGAPTPKGFAAETRFLARLMVKDPRIQIAFMQLGGWDTHVNQGASTGPLARNLGELAKGLATLQQELGPVYQHTQIMVMSEFGRTARENGNRGTDHGWGNAMWLIGGALQGGKVYGQWPGLGDGQLESDRDLAVTTDFREPIAQILKGHLGLNASGIGKVLPTFTPQNSLKLL